MVKSKSNQSKWEHNYCRVSKQHVVNTEHLWLVQDEAQIVIDVLLLLFNVAKYSTANSC